MPSINATLCRKDFEEMESVSFELGGRAVADAATAEARRFTFVVEHPCCRFQACHVSDLVRRLLVSDACVSRVCKIADNESL